MKHFWAAVILLLFDAQYGCGRTLSSLQKMPPAPKLAALDLDSLPEDIKRHYATLNSERHKSIADAPEHNDLAKDDTILKKDVDNKMGQMFSTLPLAHDRDEEAKSDRPVRTYGMKLTNNQGYVWNDLNNPRVAYTIGDSKSRPGIANEDKYKPNEHIPEMTTKSPVSNVIETAASPDGTQPGGDVIAHLEDILNILEDMKTESPVEEDKSQETDENEKETDEKKEHEREDLKEPAADIEEDGDEQETVSDSEDNTKVTKKPEMNDAIKDLMGNEQFWKWLSAWTSSYVELLMQRIGEFVKEEVATQMTAYLEAHKDQVPPNDESDQETDNDSEQNPSEDEAESTDDEVEDVEEDEGEEEEDERIQLVKKHKEEAKEDIKEVINNVNATTVYGNSVGNRNVTNIFVFYTNKKPDEIIESFTPIANENNPNNINVFLEDDNDNKAKQEEVEESTGDSNANDKHKNLESTAKESNRIENSVSTEGSVSTENSLTAENSAAPEYNDPELPPENPLEEIKEESEKVELTSDKPTDVSKEDESAKVSETNDSSKDLTEITDTDKPDAENMKDISIDVRSSFPETETNVSSERSENDEDQPATDRSEKDKVDS